MDVKYRRAEESDLEEVVEFVDYWLKGVGKRDGMLGATDDFFVSLTRQRDYLKKYDVLLACFEDAIVGWAVKTNKGVLIHLLVAGTFRGQGIGGQLLRRIRPSVVRSKFDQESGDPAEFYHKQGFVKRSSERVGKHDNIDIFVSESAAGPVIESECRSIDRIARKFKRREVVRDDAGL